MGNDLGYLPGTLEDKMGPWLTPIKDNLLSLMSGGKRNKTSKETLDMFIADGVIEIEAIPYIRGRSIADTYLIIDESQNLSIHEIKTIITRVGENSKIVLTGDIHQIDNAYLNCVSNGLSVVVEKFKESSLASHISLLKGERSEIASVAATLLNI